MFAVIRRVIDALVQAVEGDQGTLTEEGSVQLTSLPQLVLILKALLFFLTKQAILSRRSTVLSLPLQ
jgi:hypothetical protein